jgi:hypothetical protein
MSMSANDLAKSKEIYKASSEYVCLSLLAETLRGFVAKREFENLDFIKVDEQSGEVQLRALHALTQIICHKTGITMTAQLTSVTSNVQSINIRALRYLLSSLDAYIGIFN